MVIPMFAKRLQPVQGWGEVRFLKHCKLMLPSVKSHCTVYSKLANIPILLRNLCFVAGPYPRTRNTSRFSREVAAFEACLLICFPKQQFKTQETRRHNAGEDPAWSHYLHHLPNAFPCWQMKPNYHYARQHSNPGLGLKLYMVTADGSVAYIRVWPRHISSGRWRCPALRAKGAWRAAKSQSSSLHHYSHKKYAQLYQTELDGWESLRDGLWRENLRESPIHVPFCT